MWIRSQYGDTLIRYDLLEIVDYAKGVYVVVALANCGGPYKLGEYTTKEKALKVLDEIQKKVEYSGSTLISPTSLKNCYCLSTTGQFYQMPQDDEVVE